MSDAERDALRLFEVCSDMLAVTGFDGYFVTVNEAWTRTLGWSRQELLAAPYLSLVHPDDVEATQAAAKDLIEGADRFDFENRYRHRDGGYRWLSWNAVSRPEEGKLYAAVRDVTLERRLAALQSEVEVATGTGTWEVELESGHVTWSQLTHALHGTDPETFDPAVDDALAFYPLPARTELEAALAALVSTGQPYDLELQLDSLHGRRVVRTTGRALLRSGSAVHLYGTIEDITERHDERERLRRFEQRIELSEEGILEVAGDWTIAYANPRLGEMVGRDVGDLVGNPAGALFAPGEADRVAARVARQLELGADRDRDQARLVTADGRTRWVQVATRFERSTSGGLERMTAVMTDISQLKQRERDLERARQLLEEAQQLAKLGNWEANHVTGELTWSPMIYEIFGLDSGGFEPSVDAFLATIHPDDRDRVDESHRIAAETGRQDVVHRIVRPDGTVRVVHERSVADVDAAGVIVRLTGTVQDVTDLTAAQEALREVQVALERVLTATNDGWWDEDHAAGTAYYSPRWYEIHGYQPEELPADLSTWRRLTVDEDLAESDARFAEIVATRSPTFSYRRRAIHKDGHHVPLIVRGFVEYRDDGAPVRVSGATTDVTELERVDRMKEAFVSNVSHELRTPITAVGARSSSSLPASSEPCLRRRRRCSTWLHATSSDCAP